MKGMWKLMEFTLAPGNNVPDLSGIHSAYSKTENGFSAVLSYEVIMKILPELVDCLEEPVFFFLEIPCNENEEKELRKKDTDPFHYNVYYLDNCTKSVAQAILKRYGELLAADGLVKYGFGSHKTGEEIYCVKYQEIYIYGGNSFGRVFEKNAIDEEKNYKSLWDNFSEETPGECAAVEFNGETVYNIVENLSAEGMYKAEVREE